MNDVVIATRGSPLALWQAEQVAKRLAPLAGGAAVSILKIKTEGDRSQAQGNAIGSLSATGVFTREVDAAVLDGRAHVAVHSLKDQPTTLEAGLVLGMVLERGACEDALVGRGGARMSDLAPGARVASGSLRRRAQLLRLRPDLRIVEIRGNVDTRLRKLDAGEAEALVLACAGLERLGHAGRITQVFSVGEIVPAVSQGIVGVTCRESDGATRELLRRADHPETHSRAEAERSFLRRLGGGCNVPAGAHAVVEGKRLSIRARVCDRDGREVLENEAAGAVRDAAAIGEALAAALDAKGAGDLIRELRA